MKALIKSAAPAGGPYGLQWTEENGLVQEISEETTGLKGHMLERLISDIRRISGFSDVQNGERFSEVEEPESTEPKVIDPPMPPKYGPGSGKDEWLAHAKAHKISILDDAKYTDVIAAVEAHHAGE